ncbi:MAG: hypothetical protein WCI11_20310 [Candidatus Methylumidiphilus sp.]
MKKFSSLLLIVIFSHGAFFLFGRYIGHNEANQIFTNSTYSDNNNNAYKLDHHKQLSKEENIKTNSNLQVYTNTPECIQAYIALPDSQEQLIKPELSNQIAKSLNSSTLQEKMSAISFLSEYGTDESKSIIRSIALSDDESDAKAMAITLTDWSNDIDSLTSILYRSWKNTNIKVAILNAASSTDVSLNKAQFNSALFTQMADETNPNILIRILEYYKENDNFFLEQSKSIISSMPNISTDLKVYLNDNNIR